jgi:hypothetical protein
LQQSDHPLKGKTINIIIFGIDGWLPGTLAMEMAAANSNTTFLEFAEFAQENYGYTANISLAKSSFEPLFHQAKASLTNGSSEYNIIIIDSQWLGALAQGRLIVYSSCKGAVDLGAGSPRSSIAVLMVISIKATSLQSPGAKVFYIGN